MNGMDRIEWEAIAVQRGWRRGGPRGWIAPSGRDYSGEAVRRIIVVAERDRQFWAMVSSEHAVESPV